MGLKDVNFWLKKSIQIKSQDPGKSNVTCQKKIIINFITSDWILIKK